MKCSVQAVSATVTSDCDDGEGVHDGSVAKGLILQHTFALQSLIVCR